MNSTNIRQWIVGILLIGALGGCSVKRMAVNSLADALSESGSVFASDNDPELIRQALPFSLKLMEGLLAESPENQDLLLATCRGFTQYTYAFVQEDADRLELDDIEASDRQRERARKLYLRAREYGLAGLAVNHPDLVADLYDAPERALARTRAKDVPLLFWTAMSWAGAINVSRDHPELIADLPQVDALIDRVMVLNPEFEQGAVYSFLIAYEFARPGPQEEAITKARRHFERALTLSMGKQASPYVSLAESVCVTQQNRAEFMGLLEKALAIDVGQEPEHRLANILAQERARWLITQIDELFWDSRDNET